jgi:glutamyl-tRNA reductase
LIAFNSNLAAQKDQENPDDGFLTNLYYFGIDYKSSPIEVREKFAFAAHELSEVLMAFKEQIGTVVILSTCNRCEIYLSSQRSFAEVKAKTYALIAKFKNLDENLVAEHIHHLRGQLAVQHLFKVSAGLESMIIGEGQILNQIKTAYQQANGFTDSLLNRLFQQALAIGKKIRSQTNISRGAMSVPAAALQAVQKLIHPQELHSKRIMLLGSGQVAELCLDHLHSQGANTNLTIVSRSDSHEMLMSKYSVTKSVGYAQLISEIKAQDVILACTAAPHFVIKPIDLADLEHKIIICDLAVPRNVDPEVATLQGITLLDVDYLKERVYQNSQARCEETSKAERLIYNEIEELYRWIKSKNAYSIDSKSNDLSQKLA